MVSLPLQAAELDIPDDDIATVFQGADVVLIGEHHDNALHHALQTRLVVALKPSAVVFEMIEPAQARLITPALRENAVELEAHLVWEERGWPDFAMYYPIFQAALDADLFGGALPRDEVRRAVDEGAAAVFGNAAPLFGLDDSLAEAEQASREALQKAAHCDALPDNLLPGMVEAQRLRDAAIARAVLAALEADVEGPVIVIAGNGHVREDWGVPAILTSYTSSTGKSLSMLSLAQYEDKAPKEPPVTHWVVTPGVDRGDPCEAFR